MRSKLSRLFLAALAVGAVAAGNLALAQVDNVVREPDKIFIPPVTKIIFDSNGVIVGAPELPTGCPIFVSVRAGPFQRWIKIRKDFLPEAQDSVSNL